MQPESEKNNLFAGLTGGIGSIAQFAHIKVSLSLLGTLASHLLTNPQLSLPCLAWTVLMIVATIILWWFTSRPGPGIWMISMTTPMVWFFYSQDDVIIRQVSVVCFNLFFAAIRWQRLAVVLNMYCVFPMTLAPKNKNARVKKQKETPQFRESGRNLLFAVMLITIMGWCLAFANNRDITLISTIIGLIDHFIGSIAITGIILLIIVAKSTGNFKLGSGEEGNRKTGSRNAHAHSRSSSRSSSRSGGGSSGGDGSSGRWWSRCAQSLLYSLYGAFLGLPNRSLCRNCANR